MRLLSVLLEGCVTSPEEAVSAVRGGARRLELCRALETGGLTPSPGLLEEVLRALERAGQAGVPVFCMIREEPVGFVASSSGVRRAVAAAAALRDMGAAGLVAGYLTPEGRVDTQALRAVQEAGGGLPLTFHRAFDHAADRDAAFAAVSVAGVSRVLTGGGPGTAWAGRHVLRRLVQASSGASGPVILGAGGVRGDHAAALVRETGLLELHARAEAFPALGRALAPTT